MNPLRFVIVFLLASTFCSGLTSCAARKAKKAAKKQKQEIIDAKVTEELIIGNYSGHCFGKCFTTVKITQNGVFTDTNTLRNSTLQPYVYFEKNMGVKLNDSLNNGFLNLIKYIPSDFSNSAPIIGCPDCADQGGYIVIYRGKQVIVDPHNHPAEWDNLINNFRELMLKYTYEFEKL